MNFLLVFIGGGVGSVLRYQIGLLIQKTPASLPWATFIANACACAVFALFVWLYSGKFTGHSYARLLVLTGFCGGLSTFSSFGYETFLLLKQGFVLTALMNIVINAAACLFIFYAFSSKFIQAD